MEQAGQARSAPGALPPAGVDPRGAERFIVLVRVAKLIASGREMLCVLRDVSATGVKLRIFEPLVGVDIVELEMSSGERYRLQLIWSKGDVAGFRFARPIDVQALLDDRGGTHPKRPIRIHIDHTVLLHIGGETKEAKLHNISQSGACISCDERLRLRQPVTIEPDGMAPFAAKVCWRHHPRHGLVFERSFTLDALAQCLETLRKPAASAPAGSAFAGNGANITAKRRP